MRRNASVIDAELFPPFEGFPKEGLTFLRQLKKNNNREWFARHKDDFEESVRFPMQCLLSSLKAPMADIAPEIEIDSKKSIFRIYRDTRFSKNKAPYKTHIAAILHPRGHWESNAGYYVHIEPEGIYAGGGIYMPDGGQLKKIRKAIAENGREFLAIVEGKKFRKTFGTLEGNKLQRAPLGTPVDHPMIEWLKYKQFYAGVEWKAERSGSARFVQDLVGVYEELLPLIRFLNASLGR